MGILWTLPAGAGIECLGRPVYWRSDRGCRESRRRLCGCRNDGAVIGDGSFERSVRSPSVVAKQSFVQPNRIAVAGNSFGGIETVLGVERGGYCAGIDSAGGAQSWAQAPELQS